MLFGLLFTFLAACTAVFAENLEKEPCATRACREELESIVYTPPVCADEYLKRITRTLKAQSPLL